MKTAEKKTPKKTTRKRAASARNTGTKAKKTRTDAMDAAVAAAQGTFKTIEPPAHVRLTTRDQPFFDSVIEEFARSEWTDHQLEIAGFLAIAMADLEQQQFELRSEGHMIKLTSKKKGNIYLTANPRLQIVKTLSTSILSLRRSLSLHARAREGEARDAGRRRAAAKGVQEGVESAVDGDEDGLIARPTIQ